MAQQAAAIPPPPRMGQSPEATVAGLVSWVWELYSQGILSNVLATTQALNAAVDPANATAASAQNTANEALTIASDFEHWVAGTASIAETATFVDVTLTTEQADADYWVLPVVESISGAAATNSKVCNGVSNKTTTGFRISSVAAPGAGTSVTWRWLLGRSI